MPGKEMRTMFTTHIASYQKEERNLKAMLERKYEHSFFRVFFYQIGNMGGKNMVQDRARLEFGNMRYESFRTAYLV